MDSAPTKPTTTKLTTTKPTKPTTTKPTKPTTTNPNMPTTKAYDNKAYNKPESVWKSHERISCVYFPLLPLTSATQSQSIGFMPIILQ